MTEWIVVILLVVIILLVWYNRSEKMTRIVRGVGFQNEANETQVAAGVVNSAPIMDYTHTYWDGVKVTSCDECPNAVVCPDCPQYRKLEAFSDGEILEYRDVADRQLDENFRHRDVIAPRSPVFDAYNQPDNKEHYEPNPVIETDYRDFYYDLDPEFISSRERMGACIGNMHVSRKIYTGDEGLGITESETRFDKAVDLGRRACKSDKVHGKHIPVSALNLLYNDVMGLENSPPLGEGCQYFGHNGYSYKEPCWKY